MHIHIHIYAYTHTHTYTHIHIHTYTHIYTYIDAMECCRSYGRSKVRTVTPMVAFIYDGGMSAFGEGGTRTGTPLTWQWARVKSIYLPYGGIALHRQNHRCHAQVVGVRRPADAAEERFS